ncbi:CDGSH iron-sulfur domain-containing protein [Actinomadura welshii]
MTAQREPAARRVRIVPGGPVLVEGPVEVELDDGRTVVSDRFLVALCACRRSRSYPFCDTSHRRRVRAARDAREPGGD